MQTLNARGAQAERSERKAGLLEHKAGLLERKAERLVETARGKRLPKGLKGR